ncbi:unnamed protein product [Trichogramma brassicae]|uniref:Uncharacterized protein n=1 Tax=Trichogramma brassicae TaxID=86971 RepID=A0A6H5INZ8_9HYME|nr:unnamed protein product [Trichogramma brassicae]
MLGIIPQVEKPSLLDKPGPVGAFAQTSNFVMNEPLKKMVEKQQQLRDKARATSRPAATEAAASVPAPVAFRDSRSTTTSTATTTSTKTTTTTKTSSTQNDPPSYSTCVSENDPARDQQRPSLIQYAPPSYSAAVTAELQNSTESFMSLLEQQRLTSSSSSSSSSAAETAARTSTPNLATFLRPPRTSPRPMISPSAPPHPANPEAEFYNNVIETAMKRAGPFANQLDIKTVLANARHPLMPEPWVPRPMRPYIIGNEEPYRGPETAAEYLERLAEVRSAQVAAVTAQQRPPQRTADLTVGDQGAVPRPPAPRTPNPELRVEASPPAYQRSEWDLRVFPEPSPERSEYDLRVQRAPPAAPSLELDQSSVACDLGTDLRNSLLRAGLPLDLQNLSEAEYDRALTEMHRVMERAKSMLQNLRPSNNIAKHIAIAVVSCPCKTHFTGE